MNLTLFNIISHSDYMDCGNSLYFKMKFAKSQNRFYVPNGGLNKDNICLSLVGQFLLQSSPLIMNILYEKVKIDENFCKRLSAIHQAVDEIVVKNGSIIDVSSLVSKYNEGYFLVHSMLQSTSLIHDHYENCTKPEGAYSFHNLRSITHANPHLLETSLRFNEKIEDPLPIPHKTNITKFNSWNSIMAASTNENNIIHQFFHKIIDQTDFICNRSERCSRTIPMNENDFDSYSELFDLAYISFTYQFLDDLSPVTYIENISDLSDFKSTLINLTITPSIIVMQFYEVYTNYLEMGIHNSDVANLRTFINSNLFDIKMDFDSYVPPINRPKFQILAKSITMHPNIDIDSAVRLPQFPEILYEISGIGLSPAAAGFSTQKRPYQIDDDVKNGYVNSFIKYFMLEIKIRRLNKLKKDAMMELINDLTSDLLSSVHEICNSYGHSYALVKNLIGDAWYILDNDFVFAVEDLKLYFSYFSYRKLYTVVLNEKNKVIETRKILGKINNQIMYKDDSLIS
ncbi:hypothetical protein SNEBB_004415 [Seison nebaliae]|nr:hypothetical protein SNEBB_004415 [Seison nebaliae]